MPDSPIYKLEVTSALPDSLTMASVVRTPRVYKPQDLQAAIGNVIISAPGASPEPAIDWFVRYLLSDFFVLLHRTGLYNRQPDLWEALSRVSVVLVYQLQSGLYRKKRLPIYSLHLSDERERVILVAWLVSPTAALDSKRYLQLFKHFLSQASRITELNGLFLCCPAPFPQNLITLVSRLTGAPDPVARYESVLPPPHQVTLDLLEMRVLDGCDDHSHAFSLVYPDLAPRARIRAAT